METTLLIMAAGIGSRFGGGIKQLASVDDYGHIIMDYSIHDAIEAGFNRMVFIIRRDIEADFRAAIGDRIEAVCAGLGVSVGYAFQALDDIPGALPEGRSKPWGTGQAVLCAREQVRGPFAVINADDYYGVDSFQKMHDFLVAEADPSKAAMVGYRLKNTVSIHGAVTRGVCKVENGRMVDVDEVAKIRLYEDGRIADTSAGEPGRDLDPEALVSMNFWGFQPAIFDEMQAYFEGFLKNADPADIKAECLLPVMVDALLKSGRITVDMLQTDSVWFGVTYQEDRPLVQKALLELHAQGVYPEKL